MNWQQFVELVTAYLEGSLEPATHAAFEEHLHLCPGCERYLGQFRTTIAVLGELPKRVGMLLRFVPHVAPTVAPAAMPESFVPSPALMADRFAGLSLMLA